MKTWSIQHAKELYNISEWSNAYFDINEQGHVVARPKPEQGSASIDLKQLVSDCVRQGLRTPLLVRFDDILQQRVQELEQAFAKARTKFGYRSQYIPVYPIKVNQQRQVVEEILAGGNVGLEAGSKPELLAVLGMLSHKNAVVICNGYKDREYLRLALIGQQLGHTVYIIIEKLSELDMVLEVAQELDVEPVLGVRVRLSSLGHGKWQNTGGEKAKFGLTAEQMLLATEKLNAMGKTHCLRLLHCHLGSQVGNIQDIHNGFKEMARFYSELLRLGFAIDTVDVGGGLGVDYEGTHSRSFCSINYSVQEYANTITSVFSEICHLQRLPEPRLITEAGRAMTAHHAVLVTDVIDIESPLQNLELPPLSNNLPKVIQDLAQCYQDLTSRNVVECHHQVVQLSQEAQTLFIHGVLNLSDRALAEKIYRLCSGKIVTLLNPTLRPHRDILDDLNEKLANKLFCNFSLFQSIPDVWAIEQVFPILPLFGLDRYPSQRAVLQDITCDSDGRIDHYVDGHGLEATLPFPDMDLNVEPLYLGIFLVGAYQEILGDMHNLFGDTDSVHVKLNADGSYQLKTLRPGQSAAQVLEQVDFNIEILKANYQTRLEAGALSEEVRLRYWQELEKQLAGYTYLQR